MSEKACNYCVQEFWAVIFDRVLAPSLYRESTGVIVNIVLPKNCPPGHYSLVNNVPLGQYLLVNIVPLGE